MTEEEKRLAIIALSILLREQKYNKNAKKVLNQITDLKNKNS